MSCDVMVIPATAPNPELAYAFINFIHDPTNAAQNIEYTYYLSPNKDAYPMLPESIRKEKNTMGALIKSPWRSVLDTAISFVIIRPSVRNP